MHVYARLEKEPRLSSALRRYLRTCARMREITAAPASQPASQPGASRAPTMHIATLKAQSRESLSIVITLKQTTMPITSPHLYMNTPSPCHCPSSFTRAIASLSFPPTNGPYLAASIGRFISSSRCSSLIPAVIQGTLSALPHCLRKASTMELVK